VRVIRKTYWSYVIVIVLFGMGMRIMELVEGSAKGWILVYKIIDVMIISVVNSFSFLMLPLLLLFFLFLWMYDSLANRIVDYSGHIFMLSVIRFVLIVGLLSIAKASDYIMIVLMMLIAEVLRYLWMRKILLHNYK
jgi:hypothetical protein